MSEEEEHPVSWWLGRTVRRTDKDESILGPAVVLAVDDIPYAPAAWIKYPREGRDYPAFRSVDLSDLQDIETGAHGPRWGEGGPDAAMAAHRPSTDVAATGNNTSKDQSE